MRIFVSYASQDRATVEPIRYALAQAGHTVFFDRDDLPAGEEFDSRLRTAIERCHLFIMFLSPQAVDAGSYTLTELSIAERCWPDPSGRVLPVVLAPTPMATIPAYLKAVTLCEPVGNVTASVADTVKQIARRRVRRRLVPATVGSLAVLAAAAAVIHFSARGSVTQDGAPLVRIAAGTFTMGDDDFTPMRTAHVDAFDIDAQEITTSRYAEYLKATGSVPPDLWEGVDLARHAELPVVGVSWRDADGYCRWAGRRLPTSAEWERAARGSDARPYPWGTDEPTNELATFARDGDDPYANGLTPVGSHVAGRSVEGVLDLAGNASEWVSDDFRDGPDENTDGKVIRGGGWHDPPDRLLASRRWHASEEQRLDDLGFRCAR